MLLLMIIVVLNIQVVFITTVNKIYKGDKILGESQGETALLYLRESMEKSLLGTFHTSNGDPNLVDVLAYQSLIGALPGAIKPYA